MSRNMCDFLLKAVPVDWRQTHAAVVHFCLKSESLRGEKKTGSHCERQTKNGGGEGKGGRKEIQTHRDRVRN